MCSIKCIYLQAFFVQTNKYICFTRYISSYGAIQPHVVPLFKYKLSHTCTLCLIVQFKAKSVSLSISTNIKNCALISSSQICPCQYDLISFQILVMYSYSQRVCQFQSAQKQEIALYLVRYFQNSSLKLCVYFHIEPKQAQLN